MELATPPHLKPTRKLGKGGNLGRLIGAGAGAIGGAFVGNPVAGAQIGAKVGGMTGDYIDSRQAEKDAKQRPVHLRPGSLRYTGSTAHQGFAKGGTLPVTRPGVGRFVGPSHEEGGIDLPGNVEVEGGETYDQIEMKDGVPHRKGQKTTYVFSNRVRVPGSNKTFSDAHEGIVERGASDADIRQLATLQEETTGRKVNPNDSTTHTRQMKEEGPIQKARVLPGTTDIAPIGPESLQGAPTETQITRAKRANMSVLGRLFDRTEGVREAGAKALPYAPGAINTARGLFGSTDVPKAPRANISDRSVNELRRIDPRVNTRPALSRVRQSLRNLTTNPNLSNSARLAGFSRALGQERQIEATARQNERQNRNRKAELISRTQQGLDTRRGTLNQQAQVQENRNRLAARGAKSGLLATGLQQLSQVGAQKNANKMAETRDLQGMMAMLAGAPVGVQKSQLDSLLPTLDKDSTLYQSLLTYRKKLNT